MKVIVTGGAGFIGSHLVELLVEKKEIKKIFIIDNLKDGSTKNIQKILKNKKVILKKIDIRNHNDLLKIFKNTKCVFHLAAMVLVFGGIGLFEYQSRRKVSSKR